MNIEVQRARNEVKRAAELLANAEGQLATVENYEEEHELHKTLERTWAGRQVRLRINTVGRVPFDGHAVLRETPGYMDVIITHIWGGYSEFDEEGILVLIEDTRFPEGEVLVQRSQIVEFDN